MYVMALFNMFFLATIDLQLKQAIALPRHQRLCRFVKLHLVFYCSRVLVPLSLFIVPLIATFPPIAVDLHFFASKYFKVVLDNIHVC